MGKSGKMSKNKRNLKKKKGELEKNKKNQKKFKGKGT